MIHQKKVEKRRALGLDEHWKPPEDRTPVRRKHDETAADQAAETPNDTKHAGKDPKKLSEQPAKAKSTQKQPAEGGDVEGWGEDKDEDDYGKEDENAGGDAEEKDDAEGEDDEGYGKEEEEEPADEEEEEAGEDY